MSCTLSYFKILNERRKTIIHIPLKMKVTTSYFHWKRYAKVYNNYYAQSIKHDAFEQKICKCHNPSVMSQPLYI